MPATKIPFDRRPPLCLLGLGIRQHFAAKEPPRLLDRHPPRIRQLPDENVDAAAKFVRVPENNSDNSILHGPAKRPIVVEKFRQLRQRDISTTLRFLGVEPPSFKRKDLSFDSVQYILEGIAWDYSQKPNEVRHHHQRVEGAKRSDDKKTSQPREHRAFAQQKVNRRGHIPRILRDAGQRLGKVQRV